MKHHHSAAFLLSALFTLPAYANCQREAASYDLPAQQMDEALEQLAQRSGCFISTRITHTDDVQAPPLSGTYRPEEALWELLIGSGLEGYLTDDGLEVSQREQMWVKAHTQMLRTEIKGRDTLSDEEQQTYLQELDTLERSVSELAREQGFISAGEHASYERSLNELKARLKAEST